MTDLRSLNLLSLAAASGWLPVFRAASRSTLGASAMMSRFDSCDLDKKSGKIVEMASSHRASRRSSLNLGTYRVTPGIY